MITPVLEEPGHVQRDVHKYSWPEAPTELIRYPRAAGVILLLRHLYGSCGSKRHCRGSFVQIVLIQLAS